MLVLVEKDIVPENLQGLPLISNGFHKPITVTDFPVRDHTMYFRIKRRRWLDKSNGKSYSATGILLHPEPELPLSSELF